MKYDGVRDYRHQRPQNRTGIPTCPRPIQVYDEQAPETAENNLASWT
jgi:hypothetical protein